jgi:hypothetical protein
MKYLKLSLVFSVLLFIQCKTTKQPKDNTALEKTLLWKVEGNNIRTSYLFGTIHLIPEDQFLMTDKTKAVFNSTEQLVLEIDLDDPNLQMDMLKYSMLGDGKTLKDFTTEIEFKKIDTAIKDASGFSLSMFNTMKPFVVNSLLLKGLIDGKTKSYEEVFLSMAKAKDNEILGLETVLDQISVFDSMSYKDQIADIITMIDEKDMTNKVFKDMVAIYISGDISKIYDFTLKEAAKTNTMDDQELLVKRNKNWIPRIGELAKEQPTFFAVGAAHLGGTTGVINLLRAAGYTLTPIFK